MLCLTTVWCKHHADNGLIIKGVSSNWGRPFFVDNTLFPEQEYVKLTSEMFENMPNKLSKALPESAMYADVVKVFDVSKKGLQIMCDIVSQRVLCFFS